MKRHSFYQGEMFILDHKTYQIINILKDKVEASYVCDRLNGVQKVFFSLSVMNRKAKMID